MLLGDCGDAVTVRTSQTLAECAAWRCGMFWSGCLTTKRASRELITGVRRARGLREPGSKTDPRLISKKRGSGMAFA